MGTWNSKPFANDTARDWLWTLEKAKDDSVIQAAFGTDADDEETIAAAAVVEAARRQPVGKLPTEARQWVSQRGFVPADALVKQAIKAVEKIKAHSELRERWAESESLAQWLEQVDLLLAGLREVQSLPLPVRKPKAPAAPRLLHKLIAQINPGEESLLRAKLREKLETLTDVNAPLPGTLYETPLNLVVRQGLVPEVKQLIARGAELNPEIKRPDLMCTPLEAACTYGQLAIAEVLLNAGAKIHAKHDSKQGKADASRHAGNYSTALRCAVDSGNIKLVELLITRGANLRQVKFNGETLLHTLLETLGSPSLEMLEFLVRNSVDIEARNDEGETAFYKAATRYERGAMEKLLELGANPNAKNSEGETALDWFSDSKCGIEHAEVIRKLGGRLGKEIPD